MREKLTVIKVGGKIVEEEATLRQLLNDFAAIDGHKVLVHGGGRSATKIAAQLGSRVHQICVRHEEAAKRVALYQTVSSQPQLLS